MRVERLFRFFISVFVLSLAACEPKPISQMSPEDGIVRIREHHKDERWDLVLQDVSEYRSRYPYSQFAAEADLLQADSYFQGKQYPEAVVSYEEFIRKNPNHEQTELAYYRVGQAYDLQSPEEIDREQVFSLKAVEKYAVFLEKFQKSPRFAEVKSRVSVLQRRLADSHLFVARFYLKKDLFHAALGRYLKIISDYPMFDELVVEAREKAALCYERLADSLEKDPTSDLVVYYKKTGPAALRKLAEEIRRAGSAKSSSPVVH